MKNIILPTMNCDTVLKQISDFIIRKVSEVGASGCVVGLSGGVDSSTTAAIAKRAMDIQNASTGGGYELVGYIIPSRINTADDIADAEEVAGLLGIRYEILNIEPVVEAFYNTNPEAFSDRFHKGNMISRIRAAVLSTKASCEKKIIAGTGNRDEDFGIGYYTLFGDGAVHMSPISGLSKRLVREMARHLGLPEKIARRTPTAGLEPGQTDFKDLGYDYDLVELVTEGFSQGLSEDELAYHPQIVPLVESQIVLYKELFKKARFKDAGEVVRDILKRHRSAKKKLEIIHPPGPDITLEYHPGPRPVTGDALNF